MKHITFKLYVLVFVILLLSGCRTSSTTIIDTNGVVTSKNKNEILDDVLNTNLKYNTISVKSSLELVSLQSSKSMKTNCYVKIVHNKEIQLSVRIPLINTEAFRLNITPDSVSIIDRVGKKYAVESLKEITNKRNINFNFYNIQALLTNSLFVPGNIEVTKKDFKDFYVSQESNLYNIFIQDSQQTISQFKVNSSDRIQETILSNDNYKFNTSWQYSDFVKNTDGNIYPTVIKTKFKIDNKSIGLNITYNELDLNSNITIDNQLPKKYQKCSISDILNAYLK